VEPIVRRRPATRERLSTESFSEQRFTEEQNVFVRSTLAVDDLEDVNEANATFPLYRGVGPDGENVDYIVTEASNFDVAKRLGINYAPLQAACALRGSIGRTRAPSAGPHRLPLVLAGDPGTFTPGSRPPHDGDPSLRGSRESGRPRSLS